jgi:hypothetical protein
MGKKLTGRLIETHDVRTTPCGSTKDDLHFLTTRETSHGVVRDELRLKTKVSKVLFNFTSNKGAKETETLCLTSINLEDFLIIVKNTISTKPYNKEKLTDLLKTTLDKVITRQPDVFRGAKTFE